METFLSWPIFSVPGIAGAATASDAPPATTAGTEPPCAFAFPPDLPYDIGSMLADGVYEAFTSRPPIRSVRGRATNKPQTRTGLLRRALPNRLATGERVTDPLANTRIRRQTKPALVRIHLHVTADRHPYLPFPSLARAMPLIASA